LALPWQTLLAFIRIATNPRAVPQPLSTAQACTIVDRWLQQANVTTLASTERFWPILRQQLLEGRSTGPLVTDAALASLALEHGAVLCSTDRDFRRFRRLTNMCLESSPDFEKAEQDQPDTASRDRPCVGCRCGAPVHVDQLSRRSR
jgi:toxin-antitoxin system PIN domain toxin